MKKSCIPNIFTFINLSCGVFSLLFTLESNYIWAGIFILIAGLVDRYDGRIARFLEVSSDLGKELDSLADLVSFGVAPAMLSYIAFNLKNFGPYGFLGLVILIAFPICGAFRLARYNASTFNGVYTGVPITIIGCIMALYSIICVCSNFTDKLQILTIVLLIIGSYLMVSTLKLKKV
ncbi:CDP-alcohol phosphatidyltransferase family protein [Clostridium sp. HCP1S3_B4]|uniref:CDP-alcohol phosphatidyltransferase family protein n=1 Tax=unclassified Clostridium TaxID=2614128 RepID=UPI0016A6D751|nr:CDP-alcohol phosphatidyltransferase family protein [Clostridiales bacterium]MDY2729977.1 CDP-alcohol phosphatidyltransferase family protein [Clostridium sp.]NLK22579.1 CDP-diacylglycerol--serine O-phosphatidyltransferase [Clostridiales bacterium]